ncbi:MAG TPA: ankyrin repeat domain-containing protein [Phycisphaerae bacterium]|nr:ankyrin repeat domain-containing protein [Phycisphaerae bacterium]
MTDFGRAIEAGDLEDVEAFIENDPAIVDQVIRGDSYPLFVAAMYGQCEVAKLLLRRGARVDAADDNGGTPLMAAAEEGSADMVRLLLAHGANARTRDHDLSPFGGETALHCAAKNGHEEAAALLLAAGADVQVKDNNGETALGRAVAGDHAGVVELLRQHGGRE